MIGCLGVENLSSKTFDSLDAYTLGPTPLNPQLETQALKSLSAKAAKPLNLNSSLGFRVYFGYIWNPKSAA